MDADLSGYVSLITGSGAGMGAAHSRLFADRGATVIVGDINQPAAESVAAGIRSSGGMAIARPLDVTSPQSWAQMRDWLDAEYGRLDTLVNNAGITLHKSLTQTDPADWDRVMQVNLRGPFLGVLTLADLLRRSDHASVINIGSSAAMVGNPAAAYSSSKWGLRGLTKAAALELAPRIRLNAVHPGGVDTALLPAGSPARGALTRATPVGRLADADEIAPIVAFLASDDGAFITGADFCVDGGLTELGSYLEPARAGGVIPSEPSP